MRVVLFQVQVADGVVEIAVLGGQVDEFLPLLDRLVDLAARHESLRILDESASVDGHNSPLLQGADIVD
jgi:hypothetical protein